MRKLKSLVVVTLATALILSAPPPCRVRASDFLPEQNIAAQWTANAVKITFDSNGGGVAPNIQVYTYGVERSLPGACAMKKTGYTFAGWSTSSTATSAEWEPGATSATAFGYADATKAIAKTLYAVWTETLSTSNNHLKLVYKENALITTETIKTFGPYENGGVLHFYTQSFNFIKIDGKTVNYPVVFIKYIDTSSTPRYYYYEIPFYNTVQIRSASSYNLGYALYVYE